VNDAGYIYNNGFFKTASLDNINASELLVEGGAFLSTGNVENGNNGTGTAGRSFINLHAGTIRVNGFLINGNETISLTTPTGGTGGTILQTGGKFEAAQSVFAHNGGYLGTNAQRINVFNITGGKFIMTGLPPATKDSLIIHREIRISNDGQFIIDSGRVVNF